MESLPPGLTTTGVICLLILALAAMPIGLWKALQRGDMATGRELREKDRRLDTQAKTIKTLEHQLDVVLTEAMTTISPVLKAMRLAIEADNEDTS